MPAQTHRIDPRGARFSAAVTAALLATSLALGPGSTAALVLLAVQTVAFIIGTLIGPGFQPWALAFAKLIRPRLSGPPLWEDARPPRFAQAVGLGFAILGLVGWVTGFTPLFFIAVGFALLAALLNAAFNFCLGCELYLLGVRLGRRPVHPEQGS
ncbi:MAG TPA: DUF4395 domain-containing protein [Propionibacteriaceae bacterium]|nr:DUF4395 domain-containing protein [Propionibacteriaceae bacterium]